MSFFKKKSKDVDPDVVGRKVNETTVEDVDQVIENEKAIKEKILNAGALKKYITLAKVMFMMIKDYRKKVYTEVPWFTIAAITTTLIYVFSPVDVIPDFILGVGFIDDLTVISIVLGWIETDLNNYMDWKLGQDKDR